MLWAHRVSFALSLTVGDSAKKAQKCTYKTFFLFPVTAWSVCLVAAAGALWQVFHMHTLINSVRGCGCFTFIQINERRSPRDKMQAISWLLHLLSTSSRSAATSSGGQWERSWNLLYRTWVAFSWQGQHTATPERRKVKLFSFPFPHRSHICCKWCPWSRSGHLRWLNRCGGSHAINRRQEIIPVLVPKRKNQYGTKQRVNI